MKKLRKRRSRPSLGARMRRFWLVGLVAVALALWGGWTLVTLPAFKLKSLAITGLERVRGADVVARANIDRSANVWLLDRGAIARRIQALPYVGTARVHVRPLANVWLEIAERRPEACLRDAAHRAYTIDGDARVLETGCDAALPLTFVVRARLDAAPGAFLHDAELATLQRDARALAADGERFHTFSQDAFGELEATMFDGITVRFGGDEDLDRKQRLIAPILAQLGPRAAAVRSVDLRALTAPVVEYRR